jgi:putative SOS response-associated peptidase YedK
MCGRFALTEVKKEKLKDRFGVTKFPATLQPRYNISPTQDVASILNESPETLSLTRWGLVSFRAKDPAIGNRMINARAETIAQKPAFKKLIKEKRCLILADSFFEWKREKKIKRPFRIMLKDEGLFAFAGLWDTWEKEGKRVVTCLIITTDSNSLLSRIHDRMPVILSKENEKAWVSSEIAVPEALRMLKPYDPGAMRACEISTFVNSPAHDTPAVLESLNKTCE